MALAASSSAARPLLCQLRAAEKASTPPQPPVASEVVPKPKLIDLQLQSNSSSSTNNNIVMQPRVCTLRSFGDEPVLINNADSNDVSRFFDALSDYIDSSKKSHDFEIISGRLAMIVFAATVGIEAVTGNSVFKKVDLQGIEEALGACVAAISSAAVFAWCSSNRSRVGRIFGVGCNAFIDSLIDKIIDGLFYDSDLGDWSDDL